MQDEFFKKGPKCALVPQNVWRNLATFNKTYLAAAFNDRVMGSHVRLSECLRHLVSALTVYGL